MNTRYETVVCAECGKEYKQMVIDGHMDYLKLCDNCLVDMLTRNVQATVDKYVNDAILG